MPIQQMMISLFPGVTGPVGQLALVIPCIVGFAALSWQLVELPVLRQRRRFSFVARVRVVDDTAPAPVDGRAIVTHS